MLNRPAFAVFLLGLISLRAQTSPGNQLDASPAMFTMMAAMEAAGFATDLDSPSNHPLRKQVRAYLAGKKLDSVDELRGFLALHRQKDAIGELNQYISFALSIEGPPSFKFRIPDNEMPPDVAPLRGLELILPRFYEEAGLAQVWRQVLPQYEKVISEYHSPVTASLLEATYYLRNPTSGYMGRRFQVLIDLMGPPNQVQTRNYKDDYYVVVTSTPDLPMNEIRYAYLHYLLDPLALKFSEQLEKKRGLSDYAQAAQALPDAYKNDYMLLTTSSFIRALESRLTRGEGNRVAMVDLAMREGFVYTWAFADGLAEYEKQVQAMRLYFPEIVNRIDVQKEDERLSKVQFLRERPGRKIRAAQPVEVAPVLTGVEKTLGEAEDLYRDRKLDQAREVFLRVLKETGQQALQAKAYYGLARVAALERQPELAEQMFQKTLELSPDDLTKCWTLVYLGRLSTAAKEYAEAAKNYRAALKVEGGSAAARAAAEKELEKVAGKEK